jgi:hypothetical protein
VLSEVFRTGVPKLAIEFSLGGPAASPLVILPDLLLRGPREMRQYTTEAVALSRLRTSGSERFICSWAAGARQHSFYLPTTAGCIDTDLPASRPNFGQLDEPLIEIAHAHHAT